MKKVKKTNVMRTLDASKIDYIPHFNIDVDLTENKHRLLEQGNVFKTLVTQAKSKQLYVFVIPYAEVLDLKKAAKVANEKSLSMILQKDLLKFTGYMHGGCSPIGMKKSYQTFIDENAKNFDLIGISGGQVGTQVEISLTDLAKVIDVNLVDIIVK